MVGKVCENNGYLNFGVRWKIGNLLSIFIVVGPDGKSTWIRKFSINFSLIY